MKELSKGQKFCYCGDDRKDILAEFHKYVNEWGVVMPKQEPLILDFGINRFREIGLIEFWIANELNAGYCAKYLFLFDRQTCPKHQHHEKTETFFVIKGTIEVDYDGSILRMEAGDSLLVQPGKYHSITGLGPALFLEVSTPCIIKDNYFENTSIPIGGNFRG
ncbi:MAG: D-lyxose/D-mannose family sugar isomerase [Phycisphaerae bacterium]|jgi:N-acetylneuraminate synthase